MTHRVHREPRDYQREAVQSWLNHQRRGVVVLPTGSGKSFRHPFRWYNPKKPQKDMRRVGILFWRLPVYWEWSAGGLTINKKGILSSSSFQNNSKIGVYSD